MTYLGLALVAYQQKHDVEGRRLAKEIGVNESTLTRIKQGKMPDAFGLVRIMHWLVTDPDLPGPYDLQIETEV